MSVSTGSQGSSVNSMQEVMDDSSSELVMMHDDESPVNSTPSVVHKKVSFIIPFTVLGFAHHYEANSGHLAFRYFSSLFTAEIMELS